MKYFHKADRHPTLREAAVEQMLNFLEQPQKSNHKLWQEINVRYIGINFTAKQLKEIRDVILNNPHYTRSEISRQVCSIFQLYQSNGKLKKAIVIDILSGLSIKLSKTHNPQVP